MAPAKRRTASDIQSPVKSKPTATPASGGPKLNEAQARAVTHPGGPLLIVAGAGTGKTTVLIERIAWLIVERGVPADQILAVTFTERAAGELVERLDRRLPLGYVDVAASTFHGLCQRMIEEHGLEVGLPDRFRVLDTTAAWLLVRQHLDEFPLKRYRPLGNPTRFIHALLRHFSRCKDEAVTPADYLRYVEGLKLNIDGDPNLPSFARSLASARDMATEGSDAERIAEVAECYHAYQQLLLQRGCLDFGDLLVEALRLLRERPQVLARYREQFRHILVDEFQDTNYTQYEIVKLLAAPTNDLTVVGDDDQSIYKFRGASVANILQFQVDYPGCAQVVLNDNYRSRQGILDVAYRSIRRNDPNRLEVQLGSGLSKELRAVADGPAEVTWLHGATLEDEVALVVQKIVTLHGRSAEASYNDYAILVRANDHAQPFVEGLQRAGLPVQFLATRGLYRREPVQDLIAYLQLLDDYHQSGALYRVLRWPRWQLSPADLVLLTHLASRKSRSLFEVAREHRAVEGLSAAGRAGLDELLGLVERHTQLARQRPVSEVLHAALHDTGYLERLLAAAETYDGQAALRDVRAWHEAVRRFEAEAEERLVRHYLARLQLELDSGETGSVPVDPEAGPELIRVLTVHGAKGLEFRYVFLVNLVELRFPATERREPIELPEVLVKERLPEGDVHLQEERRLFYVACTRAKEGLFFTSAEEYRDGGRKKRPSVFLRELELPQPTSAHLAAPLGTSVVPAPEVDELHLLSGLRPKRFSFTQLEAFERCPLYHRFVHLYKLPLPGSAALSFGTTIHATLQEFVRRATERRNVRQGNLFAVAANDSESGGVLPTLEELLGLYAEKWVDDWFPSKQNMEEYRSRGRELLEKFYVRFGAELPDVAAVEQGCSATFGGYRFYAKIDRIDRVSGGPSAPLGTGLRLVDYKTGREPDLTSGGHLPEKVKRQLALYAAAVGQVPQWRGQPVAELAYHYLVPGELFSFTASAEDLTKVEAWVVDVIERMLASLAVPTAKLDRCGEPTCEICQLFG